MFCARNWAGISLVGVLWLAGMQQAGGCPTTLPTGLDGAAEMAADESLPFQFPVEEYAPDFDREHGFFNEASFPAPGYYHAAEDYYRPAGTPVVPFATGVVSFSAPAGGYGWLVIINHPQANLYSLYGHLSPSRRHIAADSPVQRGDLIGYLGDPDEYGGTAANPLVTHLHFGLRAGQMGDYSARGEWRYMAGWTGPCPQDLGWLQPSRVITHQAIPSGGFIAPAVSFLGRWGFELAITLNYSLAGVGFLIIAIRKKLPLLIFLDPIFVIAAGIVLNNSELLSTPALLVVGILMGYFALGWAIVNSYFKPVRIIL